MFIGLNTRRKVCSNYLGVIKDVADCAQSFRGFKVKHSKCEVFKGLKPTNKQQIRLLELKIQQANYD